MIVTWKSTCRWCLTFGHGVDQLYEIVSPEGDDLPSELTTSGSRISSSYACTVAVIALG